MSTNQTETPLAVQSDIPSQPLEGRLRWQSLLYHYRHTLILLGLLVTIVAIAYRYGTVIMLVVGDRVALEIFVQRLGWWGPFALIAANILQIIIAPIPGYMVYVVAGYLFGAWMGGVWGTIGLLLGGMGAMWIGRRLGRPIVQGIIGAETLARWEDVTRSDGALIWGVILLSPIGDVPFLLAGLSRISFKKIFVLTIITRVPAAFIAAAIGSGVLMLSFFQVGLLVIVLAVPMLMLYRYQATLLLWVEKFVRQRK